MFKIGDKLIITKRISHIYKQKAIVTHIGDGFCRVTRSKVRIQPMILVIYFIIIQVKVLNQIYKKLEMIN